MSTKHTQGPWVRGTDDWDDTEYDVIRDATGAVVCMAETEFSAYASGAFISPEEGGPNFDLIAAAPCLLAALEECKALLPGLANDAAMDAWKTAGAAIRRARGE